MKEYVFKMGKPSVKVLNSSDYRSYAWIISRDTTTAKLNDLKNFDTSLQDLNTVVVHFNASAGFRELLSGLRPYAMWSQSSRNKDIRDIEIAPYLRLEQYEKINKSMKEAYRLTDEKDQDTGRLHLPLAHLGEFVFAAPLRLFLGVYESLKHIAPLYLEHYLTPLFEQLGIDPEEYKYKPVSKEFGLQAEFIPGNTSFNGIRIISKTIVFGLRAQLARQSRVQIKDNIWNQITNLGVANFEIQDLFSPVDVVAIMSDDNYYRLAKMRACFIAQVDLWHNFMEPAYKELGFPVILPCGGDPAKCTVKVEAEDCAIRNGATPPCPVYEQDRHFYDIRRKNALHPEVYELMNDFFEGMPDNGGRLDRLENKVGGGA